MNNTPNSQRLHIAFFGMRNAGKSTLVNAVTNQEVSIVSDVAGTTTDPVSKAMELLPLGPVLIIDTPGIDDEGTLGEKRVKRTKQILANTDIAVLVTDAARDLNSDEKNLIDIFGQKGIPFVIAKNKTDLVPTPDQDGKWINVSAKTGEGIDELKEKIAASVPKKEDAPIIADLIGKNSHALLVVPIDESAPKGRLILPQQQVIRELIEKEHICTVVRDNVYEQSLKAQKPDIVICDSQVFEKIASLTPESIPLTSFSILMARAKGFLAEALKGAGAIKALRDGDKVLICEGCTHHRQCADIGTVKLPAWIKKYTGKNIDFEFASGTFFPEDLAPYSLIIHCGGCMITEREVQRRMRCAIDEGVPFTNYGTSIAFMKGILERSTKIFDI